MNLGAVLVTGLFAGGISCAAVQGGLLAGLVGRQRGTTAASPARGSARAGAGQRPTPRRKAPTTAADRRRQPHTAAASARPLAECGGAPPRSLWARAGDDLVPVGAFLAGKLVSHALLGALLGVVGGAVQLSPTVRVWTQLAAGALIIAFGLAQLDIAPFNRLTIEPPGSWSRFVRGQARSQAAFAPALLGFFTILVPCGITLSVEALALTSGSALSGAAVMAVFVVGTSPLFTILGFLARKAATAWRGRLAIATGLVVVAMGLYTLNGGLTLADSPLAARNLPQTLGFQAPPAVADASVVYRTTEGRQEVIVTASSDAYSPENIAVKAGVPTTLVLRSRDNNGCTRAFVIPSLNKEWTLPKNGDTRIDLGVLQSGELSYTCAMGMYGGQLTITA